MDVLEAVEGARAIAFAELLRQRLVKPVAVTQPALGAEWSVQVPANAYWEVVFLSQVFSTSAVVANRGAHVVGGGTDGRVLRVPPAAVQAASAGSLLVYSQAGASYSAGGVTGGTEIPLPVVTLPPGATLGSLTVNLDVGDQYTSIVLAVREWSGRQVLAACDWLADHVR